jgi:hypothetical protein
LCAALLPVCKNPTTKQIPSNLRHTTAIIFLALTTHWVWWRNFLVYSGSAMKNEVAGRILHHCVAQELTNDMIAQVSGAGTNEEGTTTVIWSSTGEMACRLDSAPDC